MDLKCENCSRIFKIKQEWIDLAIDRDVKCPCGRNHKLKLKKKVTEPKRGTEIIEEKQVSEIKVIIQNKIINLKEGTYFIGRSSFDQEVEGTIAKALPVEDDFLSRLHCLLKLTSSPNAALLLKDLNSTNGTYINGSKKKLIPENIVYLKNNDTIKVGNTEILVKIN